MELELAGLEKHTGIEIVLTQTVEEELGVRGGGDHHDSVAAAQAGLQVQCDGVGEGPRVAMQLGKMPVRRGFDQQRTDSG